MPPTTGCFCTGWCGGVTQARSQSSALGAVEGLRAWLLYCGAMLGSDTGVGQTSRIQTREKVPSSGLTLSPSTARSGFIFSN